MRGDIDRDKFILKCKDRHIHIQRKRNTDIHMYNTFTKTCPYPVTQICISASTTTNTDKSHTWALVDTCTEKYTYGETHRSTPIEKGIDKDQFILTNIVR